jgi:hypothetical protein
LLVDEEDEDDDEEPESEVFEVPSFVEPEPSDGELLASLPSREVDDRDEDEDFDRESVL